MCRVEKHYLGILDLQSAATGVDVCAIERCLGTLCTLHRVKCKCTVKEKMEQGERLTKTIIKCIIWVWKQFFFLNPVSRWIMASPECSKYGQHWTMTCSTYGLTNWQQTQASYTYMYFTNMFKRRDIQPLLGHHSSWRWQFSGLVHSCCR